MIQIMIKSRILMMSNKLEMLELLAARYKFDEIPS